MVDCKNFFCGTCVWDSTYTPPGVEGGAVGGLAAIHLPDLHLPTVRLTLKAHNDTYVNYIMQ